MSDITKAKHLLILWLSVQGLVVLLIATAGCGLFVAAMFYWIELSGTLKQEVTPNDFANTLRFLFKDLFVLVLAFLGVRIAWAGFATLLNLLQRAALIWLIVAMIRDPSTSPAKRDELLKQLMTVVTRRLIRPEHEPRSGTDDTVAIMGAAPVLLGGKPPTAP